MPRTEAGQMALVVSNKLEIRMHLTVVFRDIVSTACGIADLGKGI